MKKIKIWDDKGIVHIVYDAKEVDSFKKNVRVVLDEYFGDNKDNPIITKYYKRMGL